MPENRRHLGQKGEDLAPAHLEATGYIVRDTNYRCPWREVGTVVEKLDWTFRSHLHCTYDSRNRSHP